MPRAAARGIRPRSRTSAQTTANSRFSRMYLIILSVNVKGMCKLYRRFKEKGRTSVRPFSFSATALDLLLLRGMEMLRNRAQEGLRIFRRKNIALQDFFKRMRRAIQKRSVIGILAHRCAIQIDAGKKSLAAGIRQQFRLQRQVR